MIIRRQPLKIGMDLIFGDKKCRIIKILGQGTSSIVYKAKLNNRNVVLKELYPRDLGIVRGIDNSLIVPKNSLEIFEQYTEKFVKSFELQAEFHNNEKITNYTSDIEDIYECNNTLYAIMGIMTGNSYDNINPKNIMSVLKVGKSLAIAISYYHERNYLHLDIKPENIFILSETDELVQLFDFDTVSTKEDILQNKFSFSNNYASPEVRGSQNGNFELSDIDERADIFSIGVVIFEKIMGRLPNLSDHRDGKTWNFSSNPYLKNTVPQLQDGITNIFQKTLARNKTDRYPSAMELIQDLDKLIELAAIKVFLKSQNISPCTTKNIYISRKNICETIWNKLNQYNILYLYAIRGSGKSETAREYAETYANSYNFIQSIFYSQNLKKTIANLDFVGLKYEDKIAHTDEDIERLYSYKLDLLGNTDIYTSNILLIIDNYDYDSNPESEEYKKNVKVLSDLKKLHINIIFTTRINPTDKAHCFKLEAMSKTELEQLFFKINPVQKDDSERIKLVDEIIKVSYNHTMTVKLVALQSKKYKKSLGEYLFKLKENGLNSHIQGRITNEKDDESITMSAVYDHIKALFDFDDLSPKEKYVMVNACLLPLEGLDIVTFSNFIDLDNFDGSSSDCIDESIENLVNSGWIIYTDSDETQISLHPLICDIVTNELKPELTENKCKKFYISFLDLFSDWGNLKINNDTNCFEKENLIYSLFPKVNTVYKNKNIAKVFNYIYFHNDTQLYIKKYLLMKFNTILYYFGIDKKLVIPDYVTKIQFDAFEDCNLLIQITLGDNFLKIGDDSPHDFTFHHCTSLDKIFASDNNKHYYSHNGVLLSKDKCILILYPPGKKGAYTVPDSVIEIKDEAFLNCTSLKEVTIPDSVTKIGDSTFFGCTSLEKITIPNSMTKIRDGTFWDCTALKEITIPDSITKIGLYAFSGCTSLQEITIPNSVNKIGDGAFRDCTALKEITIPDSVTKIGDYAFGGCTSLEEITISDNVIQIGSQILDGCTSLKKLNISKQLYQKIFYKEPKFKDKKTLKKIIIPNDVNKIEDSAFLGCTTLKEITIPDSVTKIGLYAFSGCTSLQEITIPNSVNKIGDGAFSKCTSLKKITFPNSVVTQVGYNIFREGCKIGNDAFFRCTSLKEITIPNGIINIGYHAFAECTSLKKVNIPNSIPKIIRDSAFLGCTSLKEITLPESVTKIGVDAFQYHTLSKITFLNSKINISESRIGYYKDKNGLYRKNDNLTIEGYKGSTAEKYAKENGFNFVIIDEN